MKRLLGFAMACLLLLTSHALAAGPPPAEEQQGAGGESGGASVLEDSDAVILRDGTRINGTILCAGAAAVTILAKEGEGEGEEAQAVETTIPREKIERIIKNADGSFPKKFATETRDGHKFLIESESVQDAPDAEDDWPAAPAVKGRRRAAPRRAPRKKAAPAARQPKQPRARRPAAKLPGGIKLPPGVKLPPGMKIPKNIDPGKLKGAIDRLQKRGVLKKIDPKLRKAIEKAIKKQ